jgi:hypothetical protein
MMQQTWHLHRKTDPSVVKEEAPFWNTYIKTSEADLEESEARNDCAGQAQK